MTTPQAGEADTFDEGGPDPSYRIDASRLEELKRSMEVILLTRRCSTCLEAPVEIAAAPSADEQIAHILECCSQDESFIRPGMALQEIVFRMILATGNTPVLLSQLHYQLTEQWATPGNLMNVTFEGLQRVLETDDYYGFRRQQPDDAT
jgi:hypothetical protein